MKNVDMKREGDELVIRVNLKQRFGKSATGKTNIIASSEGASSAPAGSDPNEPDIKVNLNIYCK